MRVRHLEAGCLILYEGVDLQTNLGFPKKIPNFEQDLFMKIREFGKPSDLSTMRVIDKQRFDLIPS